MVKALFKIRGDEDENVDEALDDVPNVPAAVQQLLDLVTVEMVAEPEQKKEST